MQGNKRSEALKDFVAEAEEILESLNQNLLNMESSSEQSLVKPEIINSIFRGAHTLKGMAGMVGLTQVSELSHSLEDLFDKVRMGRRKVDGDLVDVLFEGVEILRKLVELASRDKKEEVDTSFLINKIKKLMSENAVENGEQFLQMAGIDPQILRVLTEYETHRLMENIKSNIHVYEVIASFKLETFDTELTALNSNLQSFGEIITNLPNSDLSASDRIQFKLIVGSSSDYSEFSQKLSKFDIQINEIGKGKNGASFPTGGTGHIQRVSPEGSSEGKKTEKFEEAGRSLKSLSQTIRVDISKLDNLLNVVGELVLTKAVIQQIGKDLVQARGFSGVEAELQKTAQILDRRITELQEGLVEIRMIPIGLVFDRLVRALRKVSKDLGKEIDLQISGEETKLDKVMIEEIADPLMHIIRNSIDHGIESTEERQKAGKPENGKIHLKAVQKGNNVVIEVMDDGKGIDREKVYKTALKKGLVQENKEYGEREVLNFLFLPGFSTKDTVTEISGRGVGLDVVSKNIGKLSGMVDIDSELGKGTKFSITLPITLVIIKALIVRIGSESYAIPLNSVSESLMIEQKDIRTVESREVIFLRDNILPLLRLERAFQVQRQERAPERMYVIVVGIAEKRIGIMVDAIEGQQEIVIKPIGEFLKGVPGIAGATELGNRKTILVLDVGTLIEESPKGETKNLQPLMSQP